ncbi:AaceriAGR080Wp [[Ashbya] aceris (nom. inval.)]|nr:AaceriAGR080Wp [[Ashbya] aceris (nom. inval.)]
MLFSRVGLLSFRRGLHLTAVQLAEEAAATSTKLSKDQLKKRELRRLAQRKAATRRPASASPLYMPVQQALRFLRAAEVGQPISQQTISVNTMVVGDKGAALLSGAVALPSPLKEIKVAVFTNDPEQAEAARTKYGCHLVGGTELVEQLKSGEVKVDFDKAFATPDIASVMAAKLGRVLGPKGLLPSAKKGTVAADLSELLGDNINSTPFKQRGNCISLAVGKCHFSDRQIMENLLAVQAAFRAAMASQKTKKTSLFGTTTLTSTHGPGIVIDFLK